MAIASNMRDPDDKRPPLDDFIGQKQVVEPLKILVDIAKTRNDPLLHILFHGPSGIGKTMLAHVLAKEMGSNIRLIAGLSIQQTGDLAVILTHLRENDILLIHDIHRMGKIEDFLYPTMEDFILHIVIGKGFGEKQVWLNLPRFTIIGTTTRRDLLTDALTSCFDAIYGLDLYSLDEIIRIVKQRAALMNIPINDDQAHEIAQQAQGVPLTALRLLKGLL